MKTFLEIFYEQEEMGAGRDARNGREFEINGFTPLLGL